MEDVEGSSAFQSPTFDKDVSIKVNEAIGGASISPSGRDVVLASRNGLQIVDLDSPYKPPRTVSNESNWDVADVQWSPFASRASWIVSTSNQKALVYNLELPVHSQKAPIEFVLHAHSRAITDINFSAHHPDELATCSVDSFIHLWDLRQAFRPSQSYTATTKSFTPMSSFADWDAAATQVKWNRQDPNIVASSHDKLLRIWDRRKGAFPLRTIVAHGTKIYGIDWNRTRSSGILTCSLDKTIKLWDYNSGDHQTIYAKPERIFRTKYPVWRARHTPFGWGVLAMPQSYNHDLHLYDRRLSEDIRPQSYVKAVHKFSGHKNSVKEFLWRSRGNIENGIDNRDFQLVSWGTDSYLHLHQMRPEYLEAVGFKKGMDVHKKPAITRQGATYTTFNSDPDPQMLAKKREEKKTAILAHAKGNLSSLFQGEVANPHQQVNIHNLPERGTMSVSPDVLGRHKPRKVVNTIQWMKGVKIGTRDTESKHKWEGRGRIIETDNTHTFGTPESLGDEIIYVGDKFKKVTFEEVDVSRRTATVYLYGPWGAEDKSVFIRIAMKFPANYPLDARPQFEIQKTTAIVNEDTLNRIAEDTNYLAAWSVSRQRGCLEAVISYLLGERNLDASLRWIEDDTPDILDNVESSSDEDEDEDDIQDTQGNEELAMSGENVLNNVNANANIPLPKQCGATWAENGLLVLFFPPRQERKPIFSMSTLRNTDVTNSRSIFNTFGRLIKSSPTPGRTMTSNHEDDSAVSAHESWASSTSSSSSGSEEEDGLPAGAFQPPAAWRRATLKFQKTSQHSSASYPNSTNPPKSVVSILDLEEGMLPCKRVLAQEYRIFGDGPSVCFHNAEIARKHGYQELGDIWELCKLILNNEVPLEVLPQQHRREQILVLARRSIVSIKRKDSGLDLQFDEADAVKNPKLKGRVKWGHHPIVTWLIPALFEYFEKLADTQMLAMLSCIFSEPAANEVTTAAMQRLRQTNLPIAMKAPAFSLDYFSSTETAWSLYKPALFIPATPAHSRFATPVTNWDKYLKPLDTYGSHGSSNGPWGSDALPSEPVTPFSTGNTPPNFSRATALRSFVTSNASSTPYSSSPEQHVLKKSTSNLASALASFSRPFTITASSSPPSQIKARNDGDLSTSAPTSGITWGTNTFISSGSNNTNPMSRTTRHGKRTSFGQADKSIYDQSDSDSDWAPGEDGASSEPNFDTGGAGGEEGGERRIKCTLKNQDQFDDEACVSAPLLNPPVEEWMMKRWREHYAEQLSIWGLVTPRAEVLKFNGLISYWSPEAPIPECEIATERGRELEEQPIKKISRAETTPTPRHSASNSLLEAPYSLSMSRTASLRRPSPAQSPRSFSFNPEAREFQPASALTLRPPPIPTSFPYQESRSHRGSNGGENDTFKNELVLDLHDAGIFLNSHNRSASTVTIPNNSGTTSPSRHQVPDIKTCAMCWLRVDGKFFFCPACGCISHVECGPDDHDAMFDGCAAGCGCECDGRGEEDGEWWERAEDEIREMEGVEWWIEEGEENEDGDADRGVEVWRRGV